MNDYSQKSNTDAQDYNPDGSLTVQGRESFRSLLRLSEEEIDRIEEVNMRHVAVDQENAKWLEQYQKDQEEWDKQYEAQQREKERLGIKPTFKVLYTSPDRIDTKSMNPAQRRAYEMSGLSTEELLSQGYIDLDDLDDSSSKDIDEPHTNNIVETNSNLPDIPF
ncbi:MAG: hypothetical protein QNJ70_20735 [Xenococcaceae cyanobacterium MO_207.B15]|nr:hypothetical protein [Xenococcaceae cyanobacterium MO_207.B15]